MKFRKKPVVIEAVQWTGTIGCAKEIEAFLGNSEWTYKNDFILIMTLEGTMKVSLDDWIIQGVKGEFYPCKPDIFEAAYEKVE